MQKSIEPSETPDSPFHAGEQFVQNQAGVRDLAERRGQKAIRHFMPEQHRKFFAQLPFMVVGSVDTGGWPWASILSGKPGFIRSPDNTTLNIAGSALQGDPLATTIKPGAALGLLGIEIPTRRRNRVNTEVTDASESGINLVVQQSFGNCPQYIQRRSVEFVRDPAETNDANQVTRFSELDGSHQAMIKTADTLFVSSYVPTDEAPGSAAADVSHRGGKPGFVKVEGNTLTIPDYAGNSFFNTLGNFQSNPMAGLLFLDFKTGDALQLSGTVDIVWQGDATVTAFRGAERAWRFTLKQGVQLGAALPFRSSLEDYSPNLANTGDWV